MSRVSKQERDEIQAIGLKANRQLGYEKRAQDEVAYYTNFLAMALLPGEFGLFSILNEGLKRTSFEIQSSILEVSNIANSAKPPVQKIAFLREPKSKIVFQNPANSDKRIKFDMLKKMPLIAVQDGLQRAKTKQTVKGARPTNIEQKIDFRKKEMVLKPQTDLSKNPNINMAQAAVDKKKKEEKAKKGLFANSPHAPKTLSPKYG